MNKITNAPAAAIIRDSLLFFVFFSLITGFIEATYTFGLLGTDIPPEIVFVLFLFSPFLLILVPRSLDSRGFAVIIGSIAIASWVISLPLDTRLRMLVMGIGCGLFLMFLACHLLQSREAASAKGAALGLGVLLCILVRSMSAGNLLLADGWRLALGVFLAVMAVILLILVKPRPERAEDAAAKIGLGRTLGLCLGLFAVLILLYFGFTSPTVIARWGGESYLVVMAVEAGALALFLGAWMSGAGFRTLLTPLALLGWNLLFILALVVTLVLRQPPFSASTEYPLFATDPGVIAHIAFWAMLVLHPVLYADFARLAGALHAGRPSARALAAGFGLGGVLVLLLALGQIFTTVYDYIPVIGPWFRDRFWLVMTVPAALAAIALLLVKTREPAPEERRPVRPAWLTAAAAIGAAALLVAGLTSARPLPAAPRPSIRLLTYNIQQGYGKDGQKNFAKQREIIRGLAPDIVGLEETDTARVAGGNSDIVRYIADGLDMYSYYGPSPVSGTFGVALLSRFPIRNARTFFMPSRGEQTACIEADVAVGDGLVHVLVTHLDNDGALPQQRLVISRAQAGGAGKTLIVAMGDFNFKPTTEQYRQTTAVLDDSWLTARERIVDPGASDPGGKIDHVFVSRGVGVLSARFIPEGPSDHPGMLAEIDW